MDDLISKKELLEYTGISYGALYRYKRKNLIPDEWFIRKSTFTGQETFFPRQAILERIEQIQNLKEDASLDRIADMLSDEVPAGLCASRTCIAGTLSPPIADMLMRQPGGDTLDFKRLLALEAAETANKSGLVALSECEQILQLMLECPEVQKGGRLVCRRQNGVLFCSVQCGDVFSVTPVIFECDISTLISGIKSRTEGGGANE